MARAAGGGWRSFRAMKVLLMMRPVMDELGAGEDHELLEQDLRTQINERRGSTMHWLASVTGKRISEAEVQVKAQCDKLQPIAGGAQHSKSWCDGLLDEAPFPMVVKAASKAGGLISIDPTTLVACRDGIKKVVWLLPISFTSPDHVEGSFHGSCTSWCELSSHSDCSS